MSTQTESCSHSQGTECSLKSHLVFSRSVKTHTYQVYKHMTCLMWFSVAYLLKISQLNVHDCIKSTVLCTCKAVSQGTKSIPEQFHNSCWSYTRAKSGRECSGRYQRSKRHLNLWSTTHVKNKNNNMRNWLLFFPNYIIWINIFIF